MRRAVVNIATAVRYATTCAVVIVAAWVWAYAAITPDWCDGSQRESLTRCEDHT